jgi:uncharacterized tellurite resistance protein B-like protein
VSILGFLGLGKRSTSVADTEAVRRIVETLDRLEPDRARYLAAFAYVLSRVAHADAGVSAEETRAMERIVVEVGGLPPEQAVVVVQMAKTQTLLFGSTEDYLVTREFDRLATPEQKRALVDCLFAVSASDDEVSMAEDGEIRRITQQLGVDHAEFIAARVRYRDRLAVLRGLRR